MVTTEELVQDTLIDVANWTDPNIIKTAKKNAISAKSTQERISLLYANLNDELARSKKKDLPRISSPKDGYEIVKAGLENLDHEEFWVICMDTRMRLIQVCVIVAGTLNAAPVRVGEIFRPAIVYNAAAILCAHNHPSGDPSPSPEDVNVTRAIVAAGKLLDIECVDHITVGKPGFVSLKERGLGFN